MRLRRSLYAYLPRSMPPETIPTRSRPKAAPPPFKWGMENRKTKRSVHPPNREMARTPRACSQDNAVVRPSLDSLSDLSAPSSGLPSANSGRRKSSPAMNCFSALCGALHKAEEGTFTAVQLCGSSGALSCEHLFSGEPISALARVYEYLVFFRMVFRERRGDLASLTTSSIENNRAMSTSNRQLNFHRLQEKVLQISCR